MFLQFGFYSFSVDAIPNHQLMPVSVGVQFNYLRICVMFLERTDNNFFNILWMDIKKPLSLHTRQFYVDVDVVF